MPSFSDFSPPRHPSREEYPEFLRFLSRCFGFRNPRWFQHHAPAHYAPTPERLRQKWVLKAGRRFAAHVGVFPFRLRTQGGFLKVAGLGGVATDPLFRGAGLMQRLMDHVDRRLQEEGYDLAVLWGDRRRYRRFGYENGPHLLQAFFTARSLEGLRPLGAVRDLRRADLQALPRLFARSPFAIHRKPFEYAALVRRRLDGKTPLTGRIWRGPGGRRAYVLFTRTEHKNLREAAEFAGDPGGILRLLAAELGRRGVREVQAALPPGSAFARAAYPLADRTVRDSRWGMVKLLRPARTLRAFGPVLARRAAALRLPKDRLVLSLGAGEVVALRSRPFLVEPLPGARPDLALDPREAATLLFGPGAPSEHLEVPRRLAPILDALFPLPFYWWRSEWI